MRKPAVRLVGADGCNLTRQETLYNVVGFIMMITAGAMAVETYHDAGKGETRDAGLAMGSLAIINAIIYLVDAFVAFRLKRA